MTLKSTIYDVFETAAGYCAIVWNDAGIVRLQLPASDAKGTERYLRRRLPEAQAGTAVMLRRTRTTGITDRMRTSPAADYPGRDYGPIN